MAISETWGKDVSLFSQIIVVTADEDEYNSMRSSASSITPILLDSLLSKSNLKPYDIFMAMFEALVSRFTDSYVFWSTTTLSSFPQI